MSIRWEQSTVHLRACFSRLFADARPYLNDVDWVLVTALMLSARGSADPRLRAGPPRSQLQRQRQLLPLPGPVAEQELTVHLALVQAGQHFAPLRCLSVAASQRARRAETVRVVSPAISWTRLASVRASSASARTPSADQQELSASSNNATATLRCFASDLRSALIRSSSCMVRAVKYDSPQLGHDHIGMRSITRRSLPVPKVRLTSFSCTSTLVQ